MPRQNSTGGKTRLGGISRGAKPSDLPIEQSTRFTLRSNLKTAKILGVTFPSTFLATADEVVE